MLLLLLLSCYTTKGSVNKKLAFVFVIVVIVIMSNKKGLILSHGTKEIVYKK